MSLYTTFNIRKHISLILSIIGKMNELINCKGNEYIDPYININNLGVLCMRENSSRPFVFILKTPPKTPGFELKKTTPT